MYTTGRSPLSAIPAAMLIMLASAMPQFRKLVGATSLYDQTSGCRYLPIASTSLRSWESSVITRKRISHSFTSIGAQLVLLTARLVGGAVMPIVVVFHERHPFAFNRVATITLGLLVSALAASSAWPIATNHVHQSPGHASRRLPIWPLTVQGPSPLGCGRWLAIC